MIDRYLLRYFLAVVDHGTFSRAAAQCNVSQPTLSVGIAKLERLLGARLFSRSNQRVHLTEAGSRLLTHARRIESEFNLAARVVREARPETVLRVGLMSSIPIGLIAPAVQAFPDIELIEGSERELVGHLARGRLDLAVTLVGRGGDRFAEEPLIEEGYRLALPASHPLAEEETVPAEALADNVMIVRRHCEALSETSRHFTERGVRPFFALRTLSDHHALAMVAAGLGLTIMPDSFSAPGVARPLMTGFTPRRTIGIAYGPHAETMEHDAPPFVAALRATAG